MTSELTRDERIEDYYYQGSTREMATRMVDLEDELAELTAPENRELVVKVLREEARLRSPWFLEFLRRERRISGNGGRVLT